MREARGWRPGQGIHFIFGARRPIVEEPLIWAETYPIEWREPRFDLAELAVSWWINKIPRKKLAERFGKTECAIQNHIQEIRRRRFDVPGLSENERKEIMHLENARKSVPKSQRLA